MITARVLKAPPVDRSAEVLTPAALEFLANLQHRFGERRTALLARRTARRAEIAAAGTLSFRTDTEHIRDSEWHVAQAPVDLRDRRVEITGPTDRRMTVNALNSGARVWLADMEDATSPTWANLVGGQLNLMDAIRRRIDFTTEDGRAYALGDTLATIVMRPRGWHLDEPHVIVDGAPMSGALFDFGLYFFHNATELLARGSGPYFYLPKMESAEEAALWNDVFGHAQAALGLPYGTIRATVLIETITAAFEMDEILYALREHASGLNAGRWDYLFSLIKNFRDSGDAFVLPDRAQVTMAAPFMDAYARLLVHTCHRRGAHAIGGMAAFIPSRRDPAVNEAAFAKVRADKDREAGIGFDGSWVAHPDLVPVCRASYDAVLGSGPDQKGAALDDPRVGARELLDVAGAGGTRTREGLDGAVAVGLRYLESWLGGRGAVAVFNLMEDVATAEISRSQIWQWLHNDVVLTSGEAVTPELVRAVIASELAAIEAEVGSSAFAAGRWADARDLFERVAIDDDFVDFLTWPGLGLLG